MIITTILWTWTGLMTLLWLTRDDQPAGLYALTLGIYLTVSAL